MYKKKTIKDLRKAINIRLAGTLVDVELEKDELDYAIGFALDIYRQRVENATKEQGIIFGVKEGQQKYDLSDREDIIDIVGIYRNSLGATASSGRDLDPFLLQFTNQMMSYAGGTNGYGSLATLDFQRQHLELLEVLMAHQPQYYFNKSTNELTFHNMINRDEAYLVVAECWRSDEELFNDPDIYPWIQSYAIAVSKQILGDARSMFQTLAGPGGGISMNGSELKQEAQVEIDKLEEELKMFVTSRMGMPFIMY